MYRAFMENQGLQAHKGKGVPLEHQGYRVQLGLLADKAILDRGVTQGLQGHLAQLAQVVHRGPSSPTSYAPPAME